MSNRHISDYFFVFIALLVVFDAAAVYKLLRFGYGLTHDWGIIARIVLPVAIILFSVWRFSDKRKKLAFSFFGVARLLALNGMFVQKHFNLGWAAMLLALLMDIGALYMSVAAFKQFNAEKKFSCEKRFLLPIVVFVCMILLLIVLGFIVGVLRG